MAARHHRIGGAKLAHRGSLIKISWRRSSASRHLGIAWRRRISINGGGAGMSALIKLVGASASASARHFGGGSASARRVSARSAQLGGVNRGNGESVALSVGIGIGGGASRSA